MLCNGCVHLHAQADLLGTVQNVHGALPGTFHLAKVIMDFRTGCIERESNTADTCIAYLFKTRGGWQCSGSRCQMNSAILFV